MELNPLDIAIHIVNIVVLYVLLRMLLYKPVSKFMAARTARIEKQQADAAAALEEANKQKDSYDALLQNAGAEAQKQLLESNRQANEQAAGILAAAKGDAQQLLQEARTKAAEERRVAIESLEGKITDMAIGLAGEILQREVNEEDNRKVIDSFFEQAG